MHQPLQPVLDISFPPPALVAIANTWHINKYYFDAAKDQWYLVVEASTTRTISTWKLQPVESEDGRPIDNAVTTSGDLWADRFSDRPFNVRIFLSGKETDTFDWFRNTYAKEKDVVCQLELFDAYNERLRYCSSHEALVRLGLCNPL